MPTIAHAGPGKVTALWGTALIRGANAKMRLLEVGDLVRPGDVILTTQAGIVEILTDEDGATLAAGKAPAGQTDDIDRVIAGLNQGDADVAPAAGVSGGGEGSLSEALRVGRVDEGLPAGALPAGAAFEPARAPDIANAPGTRFAGSALPPAPPPPAPSPPPVSADSSAISATEEGARTPLGLLAPTGTDASAVISVSRLPAIGEVRKADGTLVSVGMTLTDVELTGLVYVPPADYDGVAPVGQFGYTVQSHGDSATGETLITLAPVNDAPLASPGSTTGTEDTTLPVALAGTDLDGVVVSVTITSLPAGSTLLLADGVTAVGAGQTLTTAQAAGLLFRPAADFNGSADIGFTVSDDGGLVSAPASYGLVVTAVNDASVPANDSYATTEDTPLTLDVLANDRDPDGDPLVITAVAGQPIAAGSPVALPQGSIALNPDGTLQFTPAADFNGTFSFGYTVSDGSTTRSAAVAVNVAPAPDSAVIGGQSGGATVEDVTPTASGTLTIVDPDAGEAGFVVQTNVAGTHGTFSLDAAGQWTYTLDNADPAVQALGAGQTLAPESFTVSAIDGTTHVVSVSLTGTNDAPVAQASSFSVAEDAAVVNGKVSATDVDAGAVLGYALDVPGPAGLAFNPDGSYSFDPSGAAWQALGVGQSQLITVPYTATDEHGATSSANLVITVTGTNDAPLAQALSFGVSEDAAVVTGSIAASDVDANAVLGFALNGAAPAGLTFDADGSYRFDAGDAAYQSLASGQVVVLTVPYTVSDDQGATSVANLVITVTGVNDAAVVTGVAAGSVSEDATLVAAGKLSATDVDSPADFTAASVVGSYGNFDIDAAGSWTYTLRNGDANVQALTSSQHPTETFNVTTADGTVQQITVTVNGSNEIPSAIVTPASGAEDAPGIPVTLTGSDVDGSVASFTITALPANGTLMFAGSPVALGALIPATSGSAALSFVPNPDWNGSTSLSFSADDNEGASSPAITQGISVTAVNDAAVIGGQSSGATVEDTTTTASGTLTITDPDAGEAAFVVQNNVAGAHGTFSIDAAGTWTYALNNADPAVQALAQGQALPDETFTVASIDGTTRLVSVAITGTNDAPVANAVSASGLEDATTRTAVNLSGSDIDGSIARFTIGSLPTNGSLYANPTGGSALAVGATVTGPVYFRPAANWNGSTSFDYRATDNSGAVSANATATITIGAVNDAPTLGSLAAGVTYTESNTTTITRTVLDSAVVFADVDSPNLDGGALTVRINNAVAGQDTLDIANQGTATGQISIVGGNVLYNFGAGAVAIGSWAGGTGGTPLVVSFNANATPASVDALIQRVRYGNESQLPDTTTRSVTFTVVDGDGTANGGADTVSRTINVAIVSRNDAPSFASLGGTVAFTEGGAPVRLDSNATLNDPELGTGFTGSLNNWGGASLQLARTTGASADDRYAGIGTLTLAGGNVVLAGTTVGSYDTTALAAGRLRVTFADGTTSAQAQSVLQQITYANASDAPPRSVAIRYTIDDGNTGAQGSGGARTASGTVTVRITGVNDAPVAADDNTGTGENTVLNANVPPATDVDGTIARYTLISGPGAGNGSLTFNADGSYRFDPGSAFDSLADGATRTVSFTYRATDNANANSAPATVTITVTGTNDAAVITGVAIGSVSEDGTLVAAGALNATDVDSPANFTAASVIGSYGNFAIDAAGNWSYTLRNGDANVQALTSSQHPTETFNVTTADGTVQQITVTVNGANEAPTAAITPASGAEDAAGIPVTLTGSDVDGSVAGFTITALPANGTLMFAGSPVALGALIPATSGSAALNFVPDPDWNGSTSLSFSANDNEGASSPATTQGISVTAVNDAAVIGGQSSGATVEDTTPSASGTLTVADPDAGEAAFVTQTGAAGTYGSFNLAAAGTWTYTLADTSPAVQALAVGSSVTDSFLVSSIDGTTHTVVVTVSGTNDGPVAVASSIALAEDATTVNGNVSASDVDTGALLGFALVGTAPAGLSFNADGSYTFDPAHPAYQSLGVGQSTVLTVPLRATDEHGASSDANLVITVTGTNDGPVAVADSGALSEGSTLSTDAAGGVLANDNDVDAGDSKAVSGVAFGATAGSVGAALAGTYGTLTLDADGSYSYSATLAAADGLAAGQVVTESFSYTMRDAAGATSTATLSFTITGTNGAPTITGPLAGTVTEDTAPSASGTLTIVDPDAGESSFVAQTGVPGSYGSFSITTDGSWSYALDNAAANVQALPAGAVVTDSFTIRSADGTTRSVVITVNGTNDGPVAVGSSFGVTEDAAVVNGAVSASDVDAGAVLSYALVAAAPAGLTFNADGTYSFDPSHPAYQSLGAGQTSVITVPFTATDAEGAASTASLVITVTGTNDGPVAVADTGSLSENATLTASAATGVLANDSDIDAGDSQVVSTVSFGAASGSVGAALNGSYGTLTLNADGSYSYVADRPAAEALTAGQVVTEQFSYTLRDAAGATSSTTITFTITGTNDAPTITGPLTGAAREDTTLASTGTLVVSDTDAGQSSFVAQSGVAGSYGSFSITTAGVWTYALNNAAANVQALGAAASVTDSFSVTTADGTTRSVIVTVGGTNDAPSVVADTGAALEDNTIAGNVLSNDSDIDSGSTLALTQFSFGGTSYAAGATATVGGVGTLTMAADGAYTFTPVANYAGALPSVGYTVSDGSTTSSSTLTLSLTPVADTPTLVLNGTSITGGTTTTTLPPATGVAVAFYDNIAAVSSSNAGNVSTVEAAVETSTPTSTGTATDVSLASIGTDDAYRYTGYIHLSAGSTYTLSGTRDDTLLVKIGGNTLYSVGFNNWGSFTASTFTPTASGYYSFEVIAYNGDGVGNLDLNLSVDGGAAQNLSTGNFKLYADASTLTGSGTVVGGLVPNADGGYYATTIRGSEDSAIPLGTIAASLGDTDGSETLRITISALPVGATLTDGTRSFTATAGTTSVDVSGWTLNAITFTPSANASGTIALTVTATATDSNGSTASSSGTLSVAVTPVADAPALVVSSVLLSLVQGSGTASTIAFPILSTLVDSDGSETMRITVSGLPTTATFNHGTNLGSGAWAFTSADLGDLALTLPAGHTGTSTLTITSTATETADGSAAGTSRTLSLIADYTTATVTGTTGNDTSLNGQNSRADFIDGRAGDDVINARSGNDIVRGGDGSDDISGSSGTDVLYGDAGSDTLVGGSGSDRLVGGAGADTLTGGTGSSNSTTDVFAWTLADAGSTGSTVTDTITDFNAASAAAGGDVLDLRDLLSGDALGAGNSVGNLTNYLDFAVSGGDTTIHISANGGFTSGYTAAQENQTIVLQGVDLPSALGLASNATDTQIIQELVTRGKLIVDSGS